MISREIIEKTKNAIKRASDFDYFFDNLNSPEWIIPLYENKFFDDPYPLLHDGRHVRFPIWPASRYLIRMAEHAPKEVAKVALAIPLTENVRVNEDLADIALNLPSTLAAKFVSKAKTWLNSPYQLLLPEKLGNLISHLAKDGHSKAAMDLAKALITVSSDPSGQSDTGKEESQMYPPAQNPLAQFEEWDYEHILERNIPDLVAASPIKTLDWLCELLGKAVRLSRIRSNDEGPEDYSVFWRNAVEDHEQNFHDDLKDLLVSAVRDAAQQIATSHPEEIRHIISLLESKPCKIFQRVALHIIRLNPDTIMDWVTDRLTNRDLFYESVHEFRLLQRDLFVRLSPSAQENIFHMITNGPPDVEELISDWEQEKGERPPTEQVEKYKKNWKMKKLFLIRAALDTQWKARLDTLVSELGEPECPEFSTYAASWTGPTSPKDVEELQNLPISELKSFLVKWKPERDHRALGPSPNGLGRTLTTVIANNPQPYAEKARDFKELDPTYVRSILAGFREALKKNRSVLWAPVIELCMWVVHQPRIIEGRMVTNRDIDPDWGWTRKELASLFSVGFEHEFLSIPLNLREIVWVTLEELTNDPDPSGEDEADSYSNRWAPSSLSINSTRGLTMHAIMRYARWIRKYTENDPRQPELVGQVSDQMPEVQALLDAHLDPSRDPSHAIRSIYGQWFTTLVWLDSQWAASLVQKIFPKEDQEPTRSLHLAAWDSYIKFSKPYLRVYELLKDQYGAAICRLGSLSEDNLRSQDPEERLAEHLMIFYWHGALSLSSIGHLTQFYEKASPELCAHALGFVGRCLRECIRTPSSEVITRITDLWTWRFHTVTNPGAPTKYSKELAEFGGLFASGQMDLEWSMGQLLEVLRLVGKAEPDHLVLERLAELEPHHSANAVEALRLFVERDRDGWLLLSYKGYARTILSNAIQGTDPGGREDAIDFINWLAAKGSRQFLNLLTRQEQGG